MKKLYIAPEAALVNFAAENMMAISLEIKNGGDGETAGSNKLDLDEDWED